jgi:TPR repeat protein
MNNALGVHYFKLSADQWWAQGQFDYGHALVPINPSLAAYYFQLAADQELPQAEQSIGRCLITGTGIEQNAAAGFQYLQRAADHGLVSAQVECGKKLR